MKEFLFNPMVEEKKKRDLMKSLADDAGLSKHTLNFMYLLLDQGRLFSIAEIFDQFEIQYCKLTDTQVRSCAPCHLHRLCVSAQHSLWPREHQSNLVQMTSHPTFVSGQLVNELLQYSAGERSVQQARRLAVCSPASTPLHDAVIGLMSVACAAGGYAEVSSEAGAGAAVSHCKEAAGADRLQEYQAEACH